METTKMTIHRALSELKLIDSKIEKQIGEISPSGIYQKGKLINGYLTQEDFGATAKSKYDSITDLIGRKTKIKSAIVKANTETKVSVGGKQMTIADAITFKDVVKFQKKLIQTLKTRQNEVVGHLNKQNEIVRNNAKAITEAALGKDNVKVNKEDVDAIQLPYLAANEFHLYNPLEVDKKIELLEKEVGNFEAEVDAVLSEINAVTIIEI